MIVAFENQQAAYQLPDNKQTVKVVGHKVGN